MKVIIILKSLQDFQPYAPRRYLPGSEKDSASALVSRLTRSAFANSIYPRLRAAC